MSLGALGAMSAMMTPQPPSGTPTGGGGPNTSRYGHPQNMDYNPK